MEAFRHNKIRCRTTLASAIAKYDSERTLRTFHAPARGNKRQSDRGADKFAYTSRAKQQGPTVVHFNPLRRIEKMTSETLTDADAERIVYPFHISVVTTPFEQVLGALVDKLQSTVGAVTWNKPAQHVEWETDLRFFGQWWLVIRTADEISMAKTPNSQHPSGRQCRVSWVQGMHSEPLVPTSTSTLVKNFNDGKEENRYSPLLPYDAGAEEENQLIADLANRLSGPTDHLDIFYLNGLRMTPDRMHVLFFDGFAKLATVTQQKAAAEKEEQKRQSLLSSSAGSTKGSGSSGEVEETLATLSFSSCQMGTAGLVVLLAGIAFLAHAGLNGIRSLDLSYNNLQSTSLYAFTQMLSFTAVKRLSVRGNNLSSVDAIPFRECLLEGCSGQMEELDLSYTELTPAQVSVLIEALPRLTRLRVLLLEEVTIPLGKWPSFVRAVERTQLWYVRLGSSSAFSTDSTNTGSSVTSAIASYVKSIEEVCARNVQRAAEAGAFGAATAAHMGFFGVHTTSFFEAFFRYSQLKSLRFGANGSALPASYTAFTSNDPSLV